MAYATNPFMAQMKDEMVKRYCEKHDIDFSSLNDNDKEGIVKLSIKENSERQEALARAEEEQRRREAETKQEREFIAWCESVVPKRYASACRTDFMDSVAQLFTFEQSALIIGGNGIGKSHLAWAIAKEAKRSGKSVEVINMYRLLSSIKSAPDWYLSVDLYSKFDVLIIDEYDKCHGSESDFVLVSELVDQRYDEMLPTIIIGNGDDQQAQRLLGQSVYSRLTGDGGRLYKLGGTDRRRKN